MSNINLANSRYASRTHLLIMGLAQLFTHPPPLALINPSLNGMTYFYCSSFVLPTGGGIQFKNVIFYY